MNKVKENKNDDVLYFGYGANRDPEMMEAIIGRRPDGEETVFRGFRLGVQGWNELPTEARKMLSGSWDDKFRSYVAVPDYNSRHKIKGILWKISREERRLIDDWELTGEWYKMIVIETEIGGEKQQIEIQVMADELVKSFVSGMRYKSFVNSKRKMLAVANRSRERYLAGH